jgi:hypothetical protein
MSTSEAGGSWKEALDAAVAHFLAEGGEDPSRIIVELQRAASEGWERETQADALRRVMPLATTKVLRDARVIPVLDWLVSCWPKDDLSSLLGVFFKSPESGVVKRALEYLEKLGTEAWPELTRLLATSRRWYVLQTAVRTALGIHMGHAEILQALATNPDLEEIGPAIACLTGACSAGEFGRALAQLPRDAKERVLDAYGRRIVREEASAFDYSLHEWWNDRWHRWSEPDEGREALHYIVRAYDKHVHSVLRAQEMSHRGGEPLFSKRLEMLRRNFHNEFSRGHRRGSYESRPRVPFFSTSVLPTDGALHARLTGFSLRRPVPVDVMDVVQLPYVRAYARIDGKPINDLLRDALDDQAEFDTDLESWNGLREKLATARSRLAELEELKARREGEEIDFERSSNFQSSSNRSSPSGARDTPVDEMADVVSRLETMLYVDGHFEQLRTQSERLLKVLSGEEITWERLEPDALLGEFHPVDGAITIYRGMIRLVAGHPALRRLAPREELEHALSTIAELHEMAHAYLVLGESCDGTWWEDYGAASHLLHEALATEYTTRLVEQSEERLVKRVWHVIESMLPAEYRAKALLPASAEELRAFVLEVRAGRLVAGPTQALLQGLPVGQRSLRLRLEWISDAPGVSGVVGQGDRSNEPALGLPSQAQHGDMMQSGPHARVEVLEPRPAKMPGTK